MSTQPLDRVVPVPGLTGGKVRLRAVTPADRRTLTGFDRESAARGAIGRYQHWAAHRTGDNLQFAIETLYSGLLVGSISAILDVDGRVGRFSYGVGIGDSYRRCGYAADAITVLLSHMFFERGYRKCVVGIYGGNVASLSLHGVLGFREERRIRDTELHLGGVKYLVRMAITAPEFAAYRRPPEPQRGRHARTRRGRHWFNDKSA
ncbi:GNAT family N-acetyltransferase [Amycolatopsis lurida]